MSVDFLPHNVQFLRVILNLLPRPSFLVRWSYFLVNDVQSFGSFGPNQLPTLELDVVNNGCSQIAKGSVVKLTSILDGWKFSPDKILPNRIFVHSFIYPVFLAVDVCANSASSCHDSPEFQSKILCKDIKTGIVYVRNHSVYRTHTIITCS